MTKINLSNTIKLAGVSLTALLLLGASGCGSNQTAEPATDTNTAPETTVSPTAMNQSSQANTQTANTTVVNLQDGVFTPASVTIKVGDSVQFVNKGTSTTRVASDPHPLHTGLQGFDDLKTSKPGESYTFTFTKAGTFGFHDHLSPSSRGTVIVQ